MKPQSKSIKFSKDTILNALKNVLVLIVLLGFVYSNLYLTIQEFENPMDFGSFMTSGKLAITDSNPYAYDAKGVFQINFNEVEVGIFEKSSFSVKNPNLNPPITVFIFEQLSNFSVIKSAMIWKSISFFIYVAILCTLVAHYQIKSKIKIIWAFTLAGFWQTLEVGQIYAPLWLLFSLVWIRGEKEDNSIGGILLGVVIAIKPQFGFFALLLFMIGYKKLPLYSIISAGLISLLPLQRYGFQIYLDWLDATTKYEGTFIPGNSSFSGFFTRVGFEGLGEILGFMLILVILVYVYRKKPDFRITGLLAIVTILLAFPLTWAGYTVFLLPWFMSHNKWSWGEKISASLLTFPIMLTYGFGLSNNLAFILVGWIYGFSVVLLLIDLFLIKNWGNADYNVF